ncbi:MAG: hypothetical protein R3E88_07550 [Myxococcota bacterium]|nr:hypothetical protein [Myxococcales bacterium]
MRTWRYSRWDGTQESFALDAKRALDAMTDLMMEGLDAQEALAWMREHGFELGGANFRVMGLQELRRELRQQLESLFDRWRLDEATRSLEERLDDVLEREERAQRERHGYESSAMNEFLERRHGESERLSERIERMRDHDFADDEAGADFRELLDELDRLRALEEFAQQQGPRFRGDRAADYDEAQEIRQQVERLQQMLEQLANGDLASVSPEELAEMLGDPAAQSFVLLRDLEGSMRDAGYLRGEDPRLTPRAIRRIGAQALADVYGALRKGRPGTHETVARGVALPRPDETRPWAFGDPFDLDIVGTVMNGVKRRAAQGAAPGARVALSPDDFQIHEMDWTTQSTTVLLLDLSWSMSWAGRFPAAKRVALAMDQLVRTRYPRDHFFVVGFSTQAREIAIRDLPEVSWDMGDPFTNLQHGLEIAERLIGQHPSPSPQIIVVTDGQPTAYRESATGELRVEWPMGMGGVSPHAVAETLKTVKRVTRRGSTINTFMLDDAPELVGFVERMTQINRGRAFFSSPQQLGSFLMVDYIARRKLRRGA